MHRIDSFGPGKRRPKPDSYSDIYDVPLAKTPADAVHKLQSVKKETDAEKRP